MWRADVLGNMCVDGALKMAVVNRDKGNIDEIDKGKVRKISYRRYQWERARDCCPRQMHTESRQVWQSVMHILQ